ncbi:MAG: ribose-5-phosphate isomerase RpiA, partial [Candidatus Kryptoniota bacterium]
MNMNLKYRAAQAALKYLCSGMVIGLGSGSTAAIFIQLLAERLRDGVLRDIQGVSTSESTTELAQSLGIPLTTLDEHYTLDVHVDGADEVDSDLNLIKGLGRALLREKIVAIHAKQFIVIVDESKVARRLGSRAPLPVEIVPFAALAQVRWLNTLGCRAELWLEPDGSPVVTDNGNYLARCWFPEGIDDAYHLAQVLSERPGIVEHGLFLDMAHRVIVAGHEGILEMER